MSKFTIPGPRDQAIPAGENILKALVFVALLSASFYSANYLALMLDATTALPPVAAMAIKWTLVGLLAIADVVLLIGMGVLAHEGIHRVLFRSPFWNELIAGLLSAMAFIPFYANRQFHLTHHGYSHQPGLDPEDVAHRHSFLYAATVGSVVALAEQYRLFLAGALRIADRRYTARVLKDACLIAFTGTVYFVLVPALGISLAVTVVPLLALFPVVFAFRALSDHYGIPAAVRETKKREDLLDSDEQTWHADRERRQNEVSSWVVMTSPWLQWTWSHINYHEVHHKYPYLSHRYLPQIFEVTRGRYPYLVVHGYWRSLLNQRHRQYYPTPEQARPYLAKAQSAALN